MTADEERTALEDHDISSSVYIIAERELNGEKALEKFVADVNNIITAELGENDEPC